MLCVDIGDRIILLWNPSTMRFKELPSLENRPPPLYDNVVLPRKSYGFGYDQCADSYKVVAVLCYHVGFGKYKTQVKVHTFGTECWREIQEFPSGIPEDSGIFISGNINWLASTADPMNMVIVSLDLGNECYQEVMQPDYGDGDKEEKLLTLGLLRDCLCLISDHFTFTCVWLMKEYGRKESWTKLFNLGDIGSLSRHTIHISEDDEVLLLELGGQLSLYNSRDETFKALQIQYLDGCSMEQEVYVESLISP
jgi:F-box interacting protein